MGSEASKTHESFPVAPARDVAVTDIYRTPTAFRRALIDRLKKASETSRFDVPQLLAQFVYDRFLARVIGGDPRAWVLKGGTSLLTRLHGARHTKDIDLWLKEDIDASEQRLKHLASADLNDYFLFEVTSKGAVTGKGAVAGRRFQCKPRWATSRPTASPSTWSPVSS